jgi:tetratricopeptide (TPR) repeat protein
MKIPQPSPKVLETQRLGITDITVDYSSPATRGRDVWSNVINGYGDPNLAWRAGANMNTRISFSTDVTINGNSLKAGSYGFHIDAEGDDFTLMFAHHDNQWGSYYLDREKHVALAIKVKSEDCPFSEQLDYEFINRTDSTVVIALEWGDKRIPFTVGVDLNKTVVESFRYELLGINTYRWEAWNDAAQWCLNHDTNLEEALAWVNRSINGGYNGFSANRNVTNMTTKAQLQNRLGKTEELNNTISELTAMDMSPGETNGLTIFLLRIDKAGSAQNILTAALDKYPDAWYLKLNLGLSYYFLDNPNRALKELAVVQQEAPQNFQPRLKEIIEEVRNGTYKIPGT